MKANKITNVSTIFIFQNLILYLLFMYLCLYCLNFLFFLFYHFRMYKCIETIFLLKVDVHFEGSMYFSCMGTMNSFYKHGVCLILIEKIFHTLRFSPTEIKKVPTPHFSPTQMKIMSQLHVYFPLSLSSFCQNLSNFYHQV